MATETRLKTMTGVRRQLRQLLEPFVHDRATAPITTDLQLLAVVRTWKIGGEARQTLTEMGMRTEVRRTLAAIRDERAARGKRVTDAAAQFRAALAGKPEEVR